MKMLIAAIALTIAAPAAAQTADPHAGHDMSAGHEGHDMGEHADSMKMDCCKDADGNGKMDCCEKMGTEEAKPCCDKQDKAAHESHDGHQMKH